MPVKRIPIKYMVGHANAGFHDVCAIERNNGSGWNELVASVPCNIQHIDYRPQPADPQDASLETGETVAIHLPLAVTVRIGDRIHALIEPLRKWVVGGGNQAETLASFHIFRALRPTAATPWTQIVVMRFNNLTNEYEALPPQTAQFVLSSRVPVPVGGSLFRSGTLFGPEGLPPLDIEIGDTFRYNGMTAYVNWVTPDPSERREANFELDMPLPWRR